ncbi:shTK domain protein [Oesophagostomum dentatum]|uniref:ShTK domain protein n=1 Tax=Oesophagostomum dentatum TaxID=61180 RepID=A0A0B1TEE9_OESDE|nr:shTK domain protein [Oesophagostomum dentatum]
MKIVSKSAMNSFHILILTLLFVFHIVQAQQKQCSQPNPGPCIVGKCPLTTQSCIQITSGEVCCNNSQIVTPGIVTNAPCQDMVHPVTGVSDCPSKAAYCNNQLYAQLMAEQCPLTCHKCGGVTARPACQDFVDPRTGASNCAQMVAYCRNSLYMNLMREQCPRTCGYCS